MHIISGSKKGKNIKVSDDSFRPTQSKVREAFFNTLDVSDKTFLDLCSGSGSMGFEALSRGASHSTFIEIEKHRVKKIFENAINIFSAESLYTIRRYSALDYTKRTDLKYDIIYFDPPYNTSIYKNTVDNIISRELLSENGVLIIELDKNGLKKEEFLKRDIFEAKWYGNTGLLFYKNI